MYEQLPSRQTRIGFLRAGAESDAGAFERAIRFCNRSNSELRILSVLEVPPTGIMKRIASWGVTPDLDRQKTETEAAHAALVDMARRHGVLASAEILYGSTVYEVTQKIRDEPHALLIKAAEPPAAFPQSLFGNVDRQLFRGCGCPVWIEKPSNGAKYDRILAAVDPTLFREDAEGDPVREQLNVSILQMAAKLAEIEQAELHIVHAWQSYFAGPLQTRAGMTEEDAAEIGASFKALHEHALAELLQPFIPQITHVHLLPGRPAEVICGLVADYSFDLVVMGTVCRSGISNWLFGNTAETILHQIECSLVALKPEDWTSPQ